jgi:tight adherence protein C
VQAGYRSPRAIHLYFGAKIFALFALPLAVILGALLSGRLPLSSAMSFAGMALPIGMLLPDYWLVRRVRWRQRVVRRSLPDVLDMLVVCTEAGLGLNAAIQRVAEETSIQHPELSDELGMVMRQIRAGMDSRTALRDLVARTGLEEVRSLVATLLQSMRFGTSIADTLRVYADEMREKRLQAAEEQAAKVSVKMIIPIALFMLPGFMLIAIAPPMMRMMKSLGGGP